MSKDTDSNTAFVNDWNKTSDYSTLAFTPPFRPGSSPYCIKGLAYRGFFEDCERTVPGGKAALLEAMRQPELREFFSQEFLAASWFDVFPLPLGRQIATRLAGKTYQEYLRAQMRVAAQRDVQGVYHSVLNIELPPEDMLDRVERVANGYFNFAPSAGKVIGPNLREGVRENFPELLTAWYRPVTESYVATVVELTGATEVKVRSSTSPMPPQGGIAMVRLRFECTWKSAPQKPAP